MCNESEASVGDPTRSLVDVIATRCAQAKQVPCLTLHGIRWDQVFAAGSVAEYARLYLFAQLRGAIAHQIRLLLTPSEAAFSQGELGEAANSGKPRDDNSRSMPNIPNIWFMLPKKGGDWIPRFVSQSLVCSRWVC